MTDLVSMSEFLMFGLVVVGVLLFVVGFVLLIVHAITKKKKKTAVILMLAAVACVVLGFGVFLVSDTEPSSNVKELTEQTAQKNAESYIIAKCTSKYDCKTVKVHFTTTEIYSEHNECVLKGKVTIVDDYGDNYSAKFDIALEYSAEDGFSTQSFDMETPTKVK